MQWHCSPKPMRESRSARIARDFRDLPRGGSHEAVLREASRPEDLASYLNGEVLAAVTAVRTAAPT